MSKMKLKLDVERLTVESFDVQATEKGRGTVHGRGTSDWETCIGETCWDSCVCVSYPNYCGGGDSGLQLSCVNSCMWTCPVCRPTPGEIC